MFCKCQWCLPGLAIGSPKEGPDGHFNPTLQELGMLFRTLNKRIIRMVSLVMQMMLHFNMYFIIYYLSW